MPRRNLWLLLIVAVVALVCFRQADAVNRHRLGQMFGTFKEILDNIDEHYIEPVDDRQLFEAALAGMVDDLKDPNSSYFNPFETARSRSHVNQEFGGIGIEVSYDRNTGELIVLSPMVGAPAYEAGVQAGDKIVKINDDVVAELSAESTTQRMRGRPGTTVRLSIKREGVDDPIELKVTRAIIHTDTVLGDRRKVDGSWEYFLPWEDKLACVRVTSFGRDTAAELTRVLDQLHNQGMRGVVLDLRNNPGGLLRGAVEIARLFVANGRIVSTRGRDKLDKDVYDGTGAAPYEQMPLVVIVNGFSASASEVVAGCLQDHKRALVVGERSFGKGTVQDVIPLEHGKSELHLTIATFWRPNGENIHRGRNATDDDPWGVTPDEGCMVKMSNEQQTEWIRARRERDKVRPAGAQRPAEVDAPMPDPQLEKAIEKLRAAVAAQKD